MIDLKSKIYVAGHNGLVGSAIVRALRRKGYNNLLLKKRSELDLKNQRKVFNFIKNNKPKFIFIAAAKVGGIYANNTKRTEFILENLKINMNILESCIDIPSIKVINLGSSCIYPLNADNPISEDSFMSGKLEQTNSPYAIAKIAGIEIGRSLNIQHGAQ